MNTAAWVRGYRRAGLWLLPLVLTGACSTLPPAPPAQQHYAGRFSLAVTRAAGQSPEHEAWTGRFSLAVGAQALALDLVSPLGSTIARFETDAHEARLLVPDSGGVRVEHGADARLLSEQVLGWSLPMASLPDWVEGHPAAGRPSRALTPDGAAERFEQDGWSVRVEAPTGERPGRRVQIERPGADAAPAVVLRVVLDGPAS